MDLRNKKILVTGASGYIGYNLINFLSKYEFKVTAVSRNFRLHLPNITYIEKDLFSIEDPFHFFNKPDYCIHLAWRDGFVHNSLNHINDLPLHFNFARKLINSGLKKISMIGSMHEIGYFKGKILNDTITNPITLYGISKDALRRLLLTFNNDKVNWLRLFYIFGNDDSNSSVFGKLIKSAKNNIVDFPINSGKKKFDFIHVDDVVKQIAYATVQTEFNGIINCCSGKSTRLDNMLKKYISINNLKINLKYNSFQDKPNESPRMFGDNKIIKHLLEKYDSEFKNILRSQHK